MRARTLFHALAAGCVALAIASPATAANVSVKHGMLSSFDGTKIAYTFFMPESSRDVPVVFYTHGWGGKRARAADGMVDLFTDNGYAVLTWDARGFGDSGGEANIDSQEFEVRDTRALIDWVAEQGGVRLDAPGDPRMAMAGGSYAGAIQLMTAAADTRVDAIAPEIAWHDLVQSLKPGGVLKLGWGTLLYGAGLATGTGEGLDSPEGPEARAYSVHIHRGYAEAMTLNDWSEETREWFDARSPMHYIEGGGGYPGVKIPTLVIQGANDTLFPLNEGIHNFTTIGSSGAPTKLVVFCGGHTLNPTGTSCTATPEQGPTARTVINRAIADWFDRHIKEPLDDASTGPTVEYQLQDGTFARADRLPKLSQRGRGTGRVVNTVAPTSGALTAGTPSRDGMRVDLRVTGGDTILGAGEVTFDATLTGPEASLFFKLVDVAPDGTQTVVDDQVMAKKITRSGRYAVELGAVSWRLGEGHSLQLEISPTSNDHNSTRTPAVADLEVSVALPVITSASKDAEVLGTRFVRARPKAARAGADPGALPATGTPIARRASTVLLLGAAAIAGLLATRNPRTLGARAKR